MSELTLDRALAAATDRLRAAGCFTPGVDATLLAAHLLGLPPGRVRAAALRGDPVPDDFSGPFDELVTRRAGGVPVQHLTGRAPFRQLDLQVGPGVFIPRPETELLAQAVIDACAQCAEPLVIELCTGSGAIAAAVATEVPRARVVAVEIDPVASGYAQRNFAELDVTERVNLITADAADPTTAAEFDARAHVVVINPPYVPDGSTIAHDALHDPPVALFGGPTGRELPVRIAARARTLLRPGGWLFTEHHDTGQDELCAELRTLGFDDVTPLADLNGRPRFIAAQKPGS